MSKFGKSWFELAKEVITAAQGEETVLAFERFQQLAPSEAGKGLKDRQRVFKSLVSSGVVEDDNGTLRISIGFSPDWLNTALAEGSPEGWEILDLIDKGGRLQRKFEQGNLAAIGLEGELAVIDALRESLPSHLQNSILHISVTDDSAGYDIVAPSIHSGEMFHLEVKTSSRPLKNKFEFHISRNEAAVGARLQTWKLVFVQMQSGKAVVLGFVDFEAVEKFMPTDNHPSAKWESVLIQIDVADISSGLP